MDIVLKISKDARESIQKQTSDYNMLRLFALCSE